ncbi:class D beta-lactamase [Halodesulfovibrio sp. MK-HDV]|jgi:beta-lactamase class D|uniref:class D beta-lactamase n=1 Tax=Halodesulfovibrio sp. MK-HDV TaxID=2599925 RepID=UPI00136DB1E7|nr:class D beta-lactamase [Halodesulfovibrio sp. MK-HDV]KAF1073623.1 Beta-lactamase OXA-10 [Halodesulfovibrio sp. MK-HDV]
MLRSASCFLLVLMLTVFCTTSSFAEDAGLADLFHTNKVEGTIVISSLDGTTVFLHNKERANTQLLPASTFKMLNTLIALDEKVVANEQEILTWDGKDRGLSAWNRDHSIETALPVSCVWFYQELARRIGMKKYTKHLKAVGYGNQTAGPEISNFWLVGDLAISAFEQIEFLKALYARSLPYDKKHQDLLNKLLLVQQTPDYTLYGKTGWATRIPQPQGWFVGYVESKGTVWFFATNIVITQKSDAKYRKAITIEALKRKGIIQ